VTRIPLGVAVDAELWASSIRTASYKKRWGWWLCGAPFRAAGSSPGMGLCTNNDHLKTMKREFERKQKLTSKVPDNNSLIRQTMSGRRTVARTIHNERYR
jgi:hypothetical protein